MVKIPVLPDATCKSSCGEFDEKTICTGSVNPPKGICHGDSGGPLVSKIGAAYILHGVTSWGTGDCDEYSVFACEYNYREWICSKISRMQLKSGLSKNGLTVQQISHVIGTHGHLDHIGNLNLFPDATFIVSHDIYNGKVFISHDFDQGPFKIDEGVEVMSTPGHTGSDVSVIFRTSKCITAIVGDLCTERLRFSMSMSTADSQIPTELVYCTQC